MNTIVQDGPLKVYVGGLGPEIDEEYLIRILSEYGSLKSLHIVRERLTNVSKGYAFCEFESEQEIQNCIAGLNNKVVGNELI